MKPSEYNLDRDIPDQAGKVFFVTGGTGGIGRETVLNLIKHNPAHIIFTGRNVDSAEDVIATASIADQSAAARLHFIACDMTSLTSVRDCAATFIEGPHGARLDVLLANAGVLGPPLAPNELTKEGFEPRMGINHLAHALLIQLLLPVMRKTAKSVKNIDIGNEDDKVDASTNAAARKPRIIVLTSSAHGGPPIFYNSLRSLPSYTSLGSLWVYCQFKLANMLYAEELARREPDLTVVAIHPGVVRTKMAESTPFLLHWILKFRGYYEGSLSPEEGAYNSLWACTTTNVVDSNLPRGKLAPEQTLQTGGFYYPVGTPAKRLRFANRKGAAELWRWTEDVLESHQK